MNDNELNKLNHNFDYLSESHRRIQTQINDLVLDAGESNQEVAQARGGHQVLNDRLNSIDSQLAQKPDKDYVDTVVQASNTAFKESYDTVESLEAKYPNGDNFNHAVLSDGMIYTWVDNKWTNTGIQANGTGVADGTVTNEKLSSDVWRAVELQEAKKAIEQEPEKGNFLPGEFSSSDLAIEKENGEIELQPGGYYFFSKMVTRSPLSPGKSVSFAVKMVVDNKQSLKEIEFRDNRTNRIGSTMPMRYAGGGWYFLENVLIPDNAFDARLRIDNRNHLNPSPINIKFKFYTMQLGTKINDKYYTPIKQTLDLSERVRLIESKTKTRLKRLIPYIPPVGWRWWGRDHPLYGKIFTDGEGNFEVIGFDITEYMPTGQAYYVDKENGDDNSAQHDGKSLSTAFATMKKAFEQPDVAVIYLAEGDYYRPETLWGANQNKSIAIIGLPGHKVNLTMHNIIVYSKEPGYENVWSGPRGGLGSKVLDKRILDNGYPMELERKNSIQEVDNTPGSYAHLNGTLYVHTADGRPADDDIWALTTGYMFDFEGEVDLYLENINVIGGNSPLRVRNTETGLRPRVFGKDCTFLYSETIDNDVVMLQGVALSIFENCKAGKGQKDGFNYHSRNGIIPLSIELNCEGFENGNPEDANDQGSTTHDGGSIIRINGAYYRNNGANIAEDASAGTQSTQSLNLGCVGFESKTTFAGRNVNFHAYQNVDMWLDGCVGYGSEYNLHNWDESGDNLRVRNPKFTGELMPEGQTPVYY